MFLAYAFVKGVLRRVKTIALVVVKSDRPFRSDIYCQVERFGSDYGGWEVITEDLNSQSVVYSFGVGEDASFDISLIEKYRLTIHAFDPTPRSIEWVKRQNFPANFVMHDYGIAAIDGTVSFSPPENPDHVSHTILERPSTKSKAISVPVKKLHTIMLELGHEAIDLLKMDVEGAEYDVIDDLYQSTIRPRQILVEFHDRFPGVGIKKTRNAVARLRSMGYLLFSISVTNQEYGFIRRY